MITQSTKNQQQHTAASDDTRQAVLFVRVWPEEKAAVAAAARAAGKSMSLWIIETLKQRLLAESSQEVSA